MHRFTPTAVLFFLAAAASAEPAAVRAKAGDYVKGLIDGQDWEQQRKLAGQLRAAEGAPAALVAACLECPDLAKKVRPLTAGLGGALEGRNAETAAAVLALLRDKDDVHALFGLELMTECGLTAACAPALLEAFHSGSEPVGDRALAALANCGDDKAVALVVAESRTLDALGERAFGAISLGSGAGARARIREVVADAKQPMERRKIAMYSMLLKPGPEELSLARFVLSKAEPDLLEPALRMLEDARAELDVALLSPHLKSPNEAIRDLAHRLLSRNGDESAAKYCLERARVESDYGRGDWYVWAGMSGLASIRAGLEKAFGEETGDLIRMQILHGIAETGHESAIDMIMKYVSHPERCGDAVYALAAVGRKNPQALDASLDRLAAVEGTTPAGLDMFATAFLKKPSPGTRVRLMDAFVRLAERVKDRPRTRSVVCSVLSSMASPEFGSSENAAGRWATWWAANREAFEKSPPKEK